MISVIYLIPADPPIAHRVAALVQFVAVRLIAAAPKIVKQLFTSQIFIHQISHLMFQCTHVWRSRFLN